MRRDRSWQRVILPFGLVVASLTAPAAAGTNQEPTSAEDASRSKREFRVNRKWCMQLSPAGDLYPRYIADPRRPGFTIARANFLDSEIEDAGNSRFILRLGGRYGFIRFYREGDPDHGFQIDVEGGFFGHFDSDNSTDNIGWDGLYGIQGTWSPGNRLAYRFGMFHDSSHVGDEYAERTGRQRINYTRQEYRASVSWKFAPRWRVYGETAWAWDLRNEELMEPWRVQSGLECQSPHGLGGGRAGWYAAADVSVFEEDDGNPNLTLQGGLMYRLSELGRTYRVGLEFYDGRSHIGEFFQDKEQYVAFGFWFDL